MATVATVALLLKSRATLVPYSPQFQKVNKLATTRTIQHNLLALYTTVPRILVAVAQSLPSPPEVTTGHPMISITGQCDGLPLG